MKVNLSTPNFRENESIVNTINNSLETGWVSTGPVCAEFERKISEFTGAKYVIGVTSGTAALHLCYYAAGVEHGDEVIVPTVTFIATVNPIKYLGAEPVFMDCDDSLNMDLDKLKMFLEEETYQENGFTYNKKTNRRISLIVPVHIFGNTLDMDKLNSIVAPYNIAVIEDAAESLGSFFKDGVHSGLKSKAGAISFNANKIMTTGGGGCVITNDKDFADEIRYISQQSKDDGLRFIHNNMGFNCRLVDICAALGIQQIEQLPSFINTKVENHKKYKAYFANYSHLVEVIEFNNENQNHWFYNLKLKNYDAYTLVQKLEEYGIQTRPLWYLCHEQEYLKNCQTYKIEKATQIFTSVISVPCSTHLTSKQVEYVCETIVKILEEK